MKFNDFLSHCECRGGNWTSMILSGIKNLFPEYYSAMPDDKVYDLFEVFDILQDELGVVMTEN